MSPPVVCLDLDGVIWRGDAPIPSAAGAVAMLRAAGLRIGFLSNNSSMVVADVVAKLAHAGVDGIQRDHCISTIAAIQIQRLNQKRFAAAMADMLLRGDHVADHFTDQHGEVALEKSGAGILACRFRGRQECLPHKG